MRSGHISVGALHIVHGGVCTIVITVVCEECVSQYGWGVYSIKEGRYNTYLF